MKTLTKILYRYIFTSFVALASLATLVTQATSVAYAEDLVYTSLFSDNAASGYDVVAYFTEGKPVEGSSEFEYRWQDSDWLFSSQENLELFKTNPEQYAPQYGGYCAYAVSQGYTASSIPEAWDIVDGKLYLNFSLDVQKLWQADRAAFIKAADENWPGVL